MVRASHGSKIVPEFVGWHAAPTLGHHHRLHAQLGRTVEEFRMAGEPVVLLDLSHPAGGVHGRPPPAVHHGAFLVPNLPVFGDIEGGAAGAHQGLDLRAVPGYAVRLTSGVLPPELLELPPRALHVDAFGNVVFETNAVRLPGGARGDDNGMFNH